MAAVEERDVAGLREADDADAEVVDVLGAARLLERAGQELAELADLAVVVVAVARAAERVGVGAELLEGLGRGEARGLLGVARAAQRRVARALGGGDLRRRLGRKKRFNVAST